MSLADVATSTGSLRVASGEPLLGLQPGRITELSGDVGFGLTRLGLWLLADPSRRAPVVAVDVRGWLSPVAAWEVGVEPSRFVVVRCPDRALWPQLMAALAEGVAAVYAEVPSGVPESHLRRLAALMRARRTGAAWRSSAGALPPGVAHLRLQAREVRWEGADAGHGRLTRRHLLLEASGKGMGGMSRQIEVVEDGSHVVRVVSGMGAGEGGRAIG